MKPPVFDYHAPETLDETLQLLSEHRDSVKLLAGGQSLMPQLNMRLTRPAHIVDINRVPGLDTLHVDGQHLVVGPLVRQRTAELSPRVRTSCPLMTEALPLIGHPPIRNRGTIAGSLAYADPRAELPLVAAVLEPDLVVRKLRGHRTLKPADFFVGEFTTALQPDEMLAEIRFPHWPNRAGFAFVSVSRRQGDLALVAAAAVVRLNPDGHVAEARLGLSGVAGVPVRAAAAERLLAGARPSADLLSQAARAAAADLEPPGDVLASAGYRRSAAEAIAERALQAALQRAGQQP